MRSASSPRRATLSRREVTLFGERVPFGNDLVFECVERCQDLSLHAEICEDVWTPIPPSTLCRAGRRDRAGEPFGQQHHDRQSRIPARRCAPASRGSCVAAYLYSAAGPGESTTDLAWDGHALIYENNELLAESRRFAADEQLIIADVDLERLAQDRMRLTSFNDAAGDYRDRVCSRCDVSTSSSRCPTASSR